MIRAFLWVSSGENAGCRAIVEDRPVIEAHDAQEDLVVSPYVIGWSREQDWVGCARGLSCGGGVGRVCGMTRLVNG
jgi:hypothetical protein